MLAADLLDPAQAVLEALMVLQPTSVRVARALGIVYLRQQRAIDARRILAYGLRLDSRDTITQLLHGECVLLCGERDLGMRLLGEALAAAPASPDLHAYVLRARKCLAMAKRATP